MRSLGVVVIGRNEGERLRVCLSSIRRDKTATVYVDSGSSDGSADLARGMGWDVVELHPSLPFTAARGRNAGLDYLIRSDPGIEYVQFVDGDCELVDGWLPLAHGTLEAHPGVAAVCGRIRERLPDRSIYRRLCDVEWRKPVGEVGSCTGIAMICAQAFLQVKGFDAHVIAGEDDELCIRLRKEGWRILRLPAEMTLHDSGMNSFAQWWKRSLRAGHGFAEGAAMHGKAPGRHWVRQCRSAFLWGGALPALVLGAAWATGGLSIALALTYPLQAWRIFRRLRREGVPSRDASLYAVFCVAAKFPQVLGIMRFHTNRMLHRRTRLIEHK